jgi:diguanylate cyclase (GGDEF)-like protein
MRWIACAVMARIGGDEFAVILAHITMDQATRKATSLVEELRANPPVWNGQTLELGFSFGVYELRAGESADNAMAQADQAMYAQKRART